MSINDLALALVYRSRGDGVRCSRCATTVPATADRKPKAHTNESGAQCRGRKPTAGLPRQYVSRLLNSSDTVPAGTYIEICEILGLTPGDYSQLQPEVSRLDPAMGRRTVG